jgi:hypothetical protein
MFAADDFPGKEIRRTVKHLYDLLMRYMIARIHMPSLPRYSVTILWPQYAAGNCNYRKAVLYYIIEYKE